MQHAAPAKMRWWAVGHFSHGFDGFGTREETDGAGGRSAVLLKCCDGVSHFNMAAHMRPHRHRGIFRNMPVLLDQSRHAAQPETRAEPVNEMPRAPPHGRAPPGPVCCGSLRSVTSAHSAPRRSRSPGRSRHVITPSRSANSRATRAGSRNVRRCRLDAEDFSIGSEQRNLQQPRPFAALLQHVASRAASRAMVPSTSRSSAIGSVEALLDKSTRDRQARRDRLVRNAERLIETAHEIVKARGEWRARAVEHVGDAFQPDLCESLR